MKSQDKKRLKEALSSGVISKEMSKKDIYLSELLVLISEEPKMVKDLIKKINKIK